MNVGEVGWRNGLPCWPPLFCGRKDVGAEGAGGEILARNFLNKIPPPTCVCSK